MARLLVSNQIPEEALDGDLALPDEYRNYLGVLAHRMIWCARARDAIILPTHPDERFIAYACNLLGFARSEISVLVPPPGRQGIDLLYDDRMTEHSFVRQLETIVRDRQIDELYPFYFDDRMVELARTLHLDSTTPGFPFFAEGGAEIVNSKAAFRAFAAGNRAPIPQGLVTASLDDAYGFALELLSASHTVIVKQDHHGGGYGNEVLTPVAGVQPFGAERATYIPDSDALRAQLSESWPRHTSGGRRRAVLEHYIHDCIPIYAELSITDGGAVLYGYGEMRMKPIINGLVIPPPSAALESFPAFLDAAHRLGTAVQAIGYRGQISLDAIATPDGEILFNEFNGRVGGSTHVHLIAQEIVGPAFAGERTIVERRRCGWPTFESALVALEDNSLGFDSLTGTGVLITVGEQSPTGPTGQCLMVAATADDARAMEGTLAKIFQLD